MRVTDANLGLTGRRVVNTWVAVGEALYIAICHMSFRFPFQRSSPGQLLTKATNSEQLLRARNKKSTTRQKTREQLLLNSNRCTQCTYLPSICNPKSSSNLVQSSHLKGSSVKVQGSCTLVHCFGHHVLHSLQQGILLIFVSRVTAIFQLGCAGVVAMMCLGRVGVGMKVTRAQLGTIHQRKAFTAHDVETLCIPACEQAKIICDPLHHMR